MRSRILISALALVAATPALAAPPAPPRADVLYPLARGQTLFDLWRDYFTGPGAVGEVQRINRIADVRRISTGKVLRIPRALLRDDIIPAKLEVFSGAVTIRTGGKTHPAQVGEALGEGVGIETGRNAFVTLRLADGTALAVPSQSNLEIARLRKVRLTGALEREIRVSAGRVRAKVTPMTNPDSNFRVVTPLAVSAVRGTEFRVAYDGAAAFSAAQVDEGKVAFAEAATTSSGPLLLPPGFGAAEAGGHPTGVVKLLPPPKLEHPEIVQSGEGLHFALAPAAGAVRYHLQIAKDAGFLEAVTESSGEQATFDLPSIPADSYFVRVSALDQLGLEGSAETYSFERRRNLVSGQLDPSPPGEHRLRFRWDGTADGSPQYRFQMVRKATPDRPGDVIVVDEAGLSDRVLAVSNLGPGEYLWRVSSILIVKGKVVETWTPAQSLHVFQ